MSKKKKLPEESSIQLPALPEEVKAEIIKHKCPICDSNGKVTGKKAKCNKCSFTWLLNNKPEEEVIVKKISLHCAICDTEGIVSDIGTIAKCPKCSFTWKV